MSQYTPGGLILYRATKSSLPLWPAVVCTEDMTMPNFISTRPKGYVHLVHLIGDDVKFRWASSSEMHGYDPFQPFEDEEAIGNTPGLGEAYAISNSALEAGLSLEYWRGEVRRLQGQSAIIILSDSENENSDSASDLDDPEMRQAIRESLDLAKKSANKHLNLPTTSQSPPKRRRGLSALCSENNDTNVGATYGRIPFRPSLNEPLGQDMHFSHGTSTLAIKRRSEKSAPFVPKSSSDGLLSLRRLNQKSVVPTSDVIEGDLEASKNYVLARVGTEGEEYWFPMSSVWDRPYFRDLMHGIMYFNLNEDRLWELTHPQLANIEPGDFNFVAQFLENEQFGLQQPEGDEATGEAFAQMISAWESAEKLSAIDLLDHIVDKLERLAPWNLWEILAFACHVYKSLSLALPVQVKMKDMLARYIAQHYWIYLDDDHLSTSFSQRLKDLPELERDICVRRGTALDALLHSEADENEEKSIEREDNDEDGEEV